MKQFQGKWLIQEMELWDKDFIDMIIPDFIEIDNEGCGELRFGCVVGSIDCRTDTWGDFERLEFSFEGEDEGDPRTGRGWAILEKQKLAGRFYFHMGDDSSFIASKK